jgi:hypothetical protein
VDAIGLSDALRGSASWTERLSSLNARWLDYAKDRSKFSERLQQAWLAA